jgi:DNA-binding transcriptional ArsR family regulator
MKKFQNGKEKPRAVIENPAEIAVLASPARQEIVDTLEALGGEAPVAAIAAQLGRAPDALYYHLRLLVKSGLLVELPSDGEGRRYRTRTGSRERLKLRYQPGKTPNARAVRRVATGMLRIAGRDFADALADANVAVEGPRRALWASRAKGWVGDAELEEINRLFERISAILARGKSDDRARLVALTWVMAPIEPRTPRRDS